MAKEYFFPNMNKYDAQLMYTFKHKVAYTLQYLTEHMRANDIRDNNKCIINIPKSEMKSL